MPKQERAQIPLTHDQIAWLLHKTEKHLLVYERRVQEMEWEGEPGPGRLDAARRDVQQARAIAEQLRAQEVGE